jgi:hypothetical protein
MLTSSWNSSPARCVIPWSKSLEGISRVPPRSCWISPLKHTSGEEAVGATFVLGNVKVATGGSLTAPPKATTKGSQKGAKGGKKKQKWCPRHVVVATSNDCNDKEVHESSEEYIMATEHDFKRQAWQPKGPF